MKKKLFFLLTLLVCCVGQVWGASASYNLVTDASSLKSGDVIVIGCSSQNVAASAMGTGTFLTSVSATFKDDVLTADGAVEITLTKNEGGAWTLTTPDGAIGAKAAKKMALDDGTTTWTISIATDGTATISSTNLSYGRILYNVSSPRFLNYSSNTSATMLLPQIYKKGSVTPPTDELKSLTVSGTPTKMTYEAGEEFDPAGLTVTGTYSESGSKTVTSNIDWEITPETLTVGTTSVSVVAKVGDVESAAYTVNGLTVTEKEGPGEETTDAITNWNALFGTSYDGSISGVTKNTDILTGTTESGVVIKINSGASTNGYVKNTDFRMYNGYKMTLTAPTGYVITKVTATKSGKTIAGITADPEGLEIASGGASMEWSGSTASLVFSATTTMGFGEMSITIKASTPSTTPSISAKNVDIAAEATSGEIAYTITNPVEGQTLSASTEATWISNIQVTGEKVIFTTTANTEATERSADITLKYEGATDKVVTVTQKAAAVVLTTIDQIFAKATEAGSTAAEVSIKFDGWYVTGVKGSNAYATDGTKGFIIFEKNHGFVVGDALTGTVTCKVQLFNGSAELTQLTTSTEGLTVTPNHSISAVEKTIDQLSGINTGAVVTIKNVTYDGANFTDGTNVIVPFNSLMTLPTFEENGKYNITGVYLQFNTSAGEKKEILPRSEADIESLATTKYTITWSVNGTTTDEEVNEGAAIDFTPATVPASYTDYAFRGWTTESTVDAEPTYVTEATATENVTYYAVFAKKTTTGGSGDYELVTEAQSDWSGAYLIAYNDHIFADGREGGTTEAGMGVQNVKVDPEDNLDGTTVAASWGDLYNVTLEEVSKGSGTYLMLTKDGKYNYQPSNSNGLAATENRDTAEDHPITINFVGNNDVQLIVEKKCIFHYNTNGYFRFYKDGSQKPVYLYKKQEGSVTYSDFCTVLPAGLPVVIGTTGYATFYDEDNRIIPTGVKAYYCTQGEEGVLNTVQITSLSYIPRWTGVILEGTPGTYYLEEIPTIMADEEETDKIMDDNVLNGTLDDMSVEDLRAELGDYLVYVLSKVDGRIGFYQFVGDTLAGRKAFYVNANALVSGFILDFEGTEGINSVIRAANLKAGYDVQGRRINKMQKGINILNGKKIIK